jgi:hypothetical protein
MRMEILNSENGIGSSRLFAGVNVIDKALS